MHMEVGKIKQEMAIEDKVLVRDAERNFEERCQNDVQLATRTKYTEYREHCKIKKKHILYEAYSGRGLICSPYAIFRYLLEKKSYKSYTHLWVLENLKECKDIIREYEKYDNVKFVEFESEEYLEALATAQYLINNVSFRGYFNKRKEQIYVDTWHGIPLKSIGFDIPEGNISAGNTAKNFLMADYLISPNDFMTEIYKKAFKLDGIYRGKILQVGQPRNDRFCHAQREEVIQKLQKAGVDVAPDKKIILYAPTWKGEAYKNPDTGLETYFELIQRTEKVLGNERYQILVKPHQIVYKYIKDREEVTRQFVPATIDTNELLSMVDVLISDYSSIYFDFLVSNKPILFFVPDLKEYMGARGLYFGIDKLPGPIARSYVELEQMLGNIEAAMEPYWEKYREERQWACGLDTGDVCKRLVSAVFQRRPSRYIKKCQETSKKKILFYGGSLKPNRITDALFALLNQMDYSKYDVTLLVHNVDSSDAAINAIPQEVRVLNRSIPFCATKKEYALHSLLMDRGMDAGIAAPEAFYRREMTRMVGPCTFDYAIEFTGQSRLYALLFAHMRETKKIVWMHGAFEQEENPEQKQVQQSYLSIYPYVDRIVGCSKYIKDANFENFATPATQGKYTYMESLINVKKIRKELDENIFVDIDEKRYVILEGGNKKQSFLSVRILPAPGKEYLNFVTVGKLIPENNQITLIRAFARLHREDGNVRLYICGEGMARTDLKAVILEEQLEDAVYLVGKTEHTLPLIGTCQCFVFPACSLENQPFIREVRMLKIPLILAENEAITDVPIKNGQILVKTDEDSLYEGMKKLIMEKVPQYNFEADDYNRQCYAKFEKILDM